MALPSFDDLLRRTDAAGAMAPVVVAGGADRTVLEALREACDRGWAAPQLAGPEAEVRRLAGELGIRLDGFTLIDTKEPAPTAVAQVRAGRARFLMKGQIATPALMKAVLDPATGLRTGRVICQVVLMEIRPAGRQFLLADTGICIQPTLPQKLDILHSLIVVGRGLGAAVPRVAVMAATETPVAAMPESLEAAELQRRNQDGEITGCIVRGPLSFDLAYAADAAAKKNYADFESADAMLFPNLAAANLTVKAIMYTADCRFGGILCGAACPVVFMSRADTTSTRLHSLALALSLPPSGS